MFPAIASFIVGQEPVRYQAVIVRPNGQMFPLAGFRWPIPAAPTERKDHAVPR